MSRVAREAGGVERAWYWRLFWGRDQWYQMFIGAFGGAAVALLLDSEPEGASAGSVALWLGLVAALGAAMAWWSYRKARWPDGLELSGGDKAMVMRSVSRGDAPSEPRLAPAVAELAAHTLRSSAEPDADSRWVRYGPLLRLVGLVVWLAWVISVTLDGRTVAAAVLWTFTFATFLLSPRMTELSVETRTNAELAQAAARAMTPTGRHTRGRS